MNPARITPANDGVRNSRSRRTLHGRSCLVALALSVLPLGAGFFGFPATLHAQEAEASEEKVKAAYLYKFLNYVEWPASSSAGPGAPYVIGVIGDDRVANELASIIRGKTVNDRPVTSKRIVYGEPLISFDMVFIGLGERDRQAALLRQLRRLPVLSVTETDGALDLGSMINFRIVDGRVRFEAAPDAADQAGLKLSARLLGVAVNVVKGSR